MDEKPIKIRWNFSIYSYRRGTFLLGLNFNTNTDYGERESYIIFYLGKWSVSIGRFV